MPRCSKIRYRDKLAAMLALADCGLRAHKRPEREEFRAYECPRCNGWHLTAQPLATAPQSQTERSHP